MTQLATWLHVWLSVPQLSLSGKGASFPIPICSDPAVLILGSQSMRVKTSIKTVVITLRKECSVTNCRWKCLLSFLLPPFSGNTCISSGGGLENSELTKSTGKQNSRCKSRPRTCRETPQQIITDPSKEMNAWNFHSSLRKSFTKALWPGFQYLVLSSRAQGMREVWDGLARGHGMFCTAIHSVPLPMWMRRGKTWDWATFTRWTRSASVTQTRASQTSKNPAISTWFPEIYIFSLSVARFIWRCQSKIAETLLHISTFPPEQWQAANKHLSGLTKLSPQLCSLSTFTSTTLLQGPHLTCSSTTLILKRWEAVIKTSREQECNFACYTSACKLVQPLLIPSPHPSSTGMAAGTLLQSLFWQWWAHLLFPPFSSYLFTRSSPFTEAGIRLLFAPGAVSFSRHWNEYARWKDCSLVKSCALFCLLNNHWCLCKRDFSKNTSSLAGLQAVKRNPTATTKSPVFSRQSYFS